MRFEQSTEQAAILDALRRYTAKEYGLERRHAWAAAQDFSRHAWAFFAELGLLALPLPEAAGGLGGDSADVMVVMEGLGEALMLEPYLATVVLCGDLLATAESRPRETLLRAIAQGELRMALAHFEPGTRYSRTSVQTRASRNAGSWRLSGRKAVVLSAQHTHKLIVSARTSGTGDAPEGISLFIVDATAPGITLHGYRMHDGTAAAEVDLQEVDVAAIDMLGHADEAMPHIERALDLGTAALCAEAVGAMDALLRQTVDHLRTRRQFGQPLGSFQALRHRAAEMMIHLEQARALTLLAALQAQGDARIRAQAVSAAKVMVGSAARFVGQEAVQLHGGMGLTNELSVGHHFKRLTMIEAALGDTDFHLSRVSDALLENQETGVPDCRVRA
jgi:alkylation response protein AidB-like acyl-CoA dehydrogenase